jgi:SH3-like domain-containing protein
MSASPVGSWLGALLSAPLFAALLASPVLAQSPVPQSATGGKAAPAHQATSSPKPSQPKPAFEAKRPAPAQPGQAAHSSGYQKPAPPQKSAAGKHGPAKAAGTAAGVAAIPAPAAPKKPEPPAAAPEKPPEQAKGTATGLPLPRFAALRSDEVNMRAGPGTRYPIDWVYKRRDLPVQIEREFEVWRLVSDPTGTKGWVHQATLTGRRSFIVTGIAPRMLLRQPDEKAAPVAELKPGVVGHIRSCDAGSVWCQVQVGEYRGFLRRDAFWGAQPREAVN